MKVAVLFDHFGPYHVARLRAAARIDEVIGVEFSARSGEYAWDLADRSGVVISTLAGGRSLESCLEDLSPDVVAIPGWSGTKALKALNWCLARRIPAMVMSESTAHDEIRQPWKEFIKRRLVGLFSSALAGGSAHASYLVQLDMAAEWIALGYDAVDNEHFARSERRCHSSSNCFLASARFIEKKNLPRLIQAYARYRQIAAADQSSLSIWNLQLLGDGALRGQLETLSAELGVRDSVSMPGFKQYDELPACYAGADAFVHASTTEQWGLVVNEAMASGLPVLVSNRCGCAPDLVAEGINGFTFDPFDIESMAQTMATMANSPQDRRKVMGEESQKKIADWGPDRFARGLRDAASCAMRIGPRKASLVDRVLLKALMRR